MIVKRDPRRRRRHGLEYRAIAVRLLRDSLPALVFGVIWCLPILSRGRPVSGPFAVAMSLALVGVILVPILRTCWRARDASAGAFALVTLLSTILFLALGYLGFILGVSAALICFLFLTEPSLRLELSEAAVYMPWLISGLQRFRRLHRGP